MDLDLPDPSRPDVHAPMFSTWRVGTPQRQRAAIDAIATTWDAAPWPTPDLKSYSVFPGTGGDTLLHFSQWTDDAAYREFVATHRQERNDAIDAAVPGIERVGLFTYLHHRSTEALAGRPTCFAVTVAELDGPARQRDWADQVGTVADGLIVTHVFLGTDGSRVLLLQDWTIEDAQRAAPPASGAAVTVQRFGYPLHLAAR